MEISREAVGGPPRDGVESWVDRYGDALYRFAVLRLGETQAAEDLVQETFLAAIAAKRGFRNEATRSTWLFAILKRKVADHFRRQRKGLASFDETENLQQAGTNSRRWSDNPAEIFENQEFQQTFNDCVDKLPNKLAEVFILREVNQHSPKEIREMLGVSATNLSMRLHRCRLAMRDCLNLNWFQEDE